MNDLFNSIIGFFISDASAQTGGAGAGSMPMTIMMVLMFVVFYFLLIRPQQKRQKEHKNMVAGMTKGDEVVTMGGVLGKVTAVDDNFLTVEIAIGMDIRVHRMSVQAMMPKGTY